MTELSKVYEPHDVEKRWYTHWEREGYFHASIDPKKEPFTIVIPPPNITGELHMGHALNNTLQDIMIRWRRMQGRSALWLPGTDHAGIATQVRVEQELAREGLKKEELGRQEFLERVWAWKKEYGGRITTQLRRLGSSCDWDRERFTLDEGCSKAVREVFVRLYEKGLIYQGDYLVNWCPCCGTTLSDIEVEYEEKEGHIYHLIYPLEKGGSITVATTRPETMLGDSGIAVHPHDERYKELIGQNAILPILNRPLPIFADMYVDKEFGTGMVKVTPAHDPNDFEMGERHNLEVIKVIDERGEMTEATGPYKGLSVLECRERLLEDLREEGYLLKIEEYSHAVGHCYRCTNIIEPLTSRQWFVKMKPLARPAISVVKEGKVEYVPQRFQKVYLNWMEGIRDWCISRQLWWGHQIPVWYCKDCSEVMVLREDPHECRVCQSTDLHQDPDVLDTWFSSALWPFSTLGWPEETEDLKYFYPTDVLVTARDIIFFWVARMIFSGIEFMGEEPFSEVLIHGLVLDDLGRKMSKSLDNGIDPLEIIEEYGADTLRFTLITGNTPGNDLRFRKERLEASRNFANKIWNASRFVLMNIDQVHLLGELKLQDLSLADSWILSRLQNLKKALKDNLEAHLFGEAGQRLYDFVWGEFCDWYLELSKKSLYGEKEKKEVTQKVLLKTLEEILSLLHPFLPFITEEIWQKIPGTGVTIMLREWPHVEEQYLSSSIEESMESLMDSIRQIRRIRNEMKIDSNKKITCYLRPSRREEEEFFIKNREYLEELGGLDRLEISTTLDPGTEKVISMMSGRNQIFLPLEGMVDLREERRRVEKDLHKVEKEIKRAKGKLENKGFLTKAPEELVQEEREKLEKYKEQEETLKDRLKIL